MQHAAADKRRIAAIDLARGLALLAMAVYHFAWDLEFFGYVEAGTATSGGWKLFARAIASSFLFLVGVSLWLAHAQGVRWASFLKRLAMIAAAAGAISAATWVATPDAFIFFGILHHIALASLLGLAFLRLPPAALLLAGLFVVALPFWLRSPLFDHPALWWTGLSPVHPRSNDFVPVFPWFAAVLAGIAAAALAARSGLFGRLAGRPLGRWTQPLQLAGRHGLFVYLVHQPVLIACIWLFAQAFPAAPADPRVGFLSACAAQCAEVREDGFCTAYCLCMLDAVEGAQIMDEVLSPRESPAATSRLQEMAGQCSLDADGPTDFGNGGEETP